jgi:putative flippase GtrA
VAETTQNAASYAGLAGAIMIGNLFVLNFLTSGLGFSATFAKIITEIFFFALSYLIQKKLIFTHKRKELQI